MSEAIAFFTRIEGRRLLNVLAGANDLRQFELGAAGVARLVAEGADIVWQDMRQVRDSKS